jgi:hypothetical protein
MSSNPQLPPPSHRRDTGFNQILVLFLSIIILLLILLAGASTSAVPSMADKASAEGARVFIAQPADGATVPATFTVVMSAQGLIVEPAGEIRPGAGHMHLLINQDFVPAGEVIPIDTENYLHFGQGQLETTLTLEPGTHTLRLQFADGAHQALAGDQYRDEITVTVGQP